MAAEYFGICQICGNRQKSSEHAIAKHGYTMRFGWQMGACWGSGYAPIEVSCDRIASAIEHAKQYILDSEDEIASLKASPLYRDGKIVASVRVTDVDERAYSDWRMVTVGRVDNFNFGAFGTDGKAYTADVGTAYTAEEMIERLVKHRTKYLRLTIEQAQQNIVEMTERVANWKPTDLTPVTAADRAKEGPKVHFQKAGYGYKHSTACTSSAMAAQRGTGRVMTEDREKVTCSACLKELARLDDLPRLRAEKAAKALAANIKDAERDVRDYTKYVKQAAKAGDDLNVIHYTERLNQSTARLTELKAQAAAATPAQ